MGKAISEFKSEAAGRIYVEKASGGDDKPYEVWYEDFCILGLGDSELSALQDAAKHTADIGLLIAQALNTTAASSGGG